MITLTFRAVSGEPVTTIRAAHFRICADGTLRGADNSVAARYRDGYWQSGTRCYRTLECEAALRLRVRRWDGGSEYLGPFERLRVTGGAIFSTDVYLGAHARGDPHLQSAQVWREVALLSQE